MLALTALVIVVTAAALQRAHFSPPLWKTERARVLFIGSSHVGNGIALAIPAYGPEVAVLHYPGMDSVLALSAYRRHKERWPALAVAVLELDEFVLLSDIEKSRKADMSSLATRLGLEAWDLPNFPEEPVRLLWRLRNLLMGRGLLLMQPDLRLSTPAVLRRVHGTSEVFAVSSSAVVPSFPVVFDPSKGRARVEFIERLKRTNVQDNIDAFLELVSLLYRCGVQVVFLTVPTHASYTTVRPPEWDVLLQRVAAEAEAAVGEPIPWWQMRTNAGFEDEALYQNLDHLNREGAAKLADVLKPRIEELLR